MRLNLLPSRYPALVRALHCDGDASCTRRMHEMGFDEGVRVEILHTAPMGGPLAVRVGDTTVALRRAQAAQVELEWREAAE